MDDYIGCLEFFYRSMQIRTITAADETNGVEDAIRQIWSSGFLEMAPHAYDSIASSPVPVATLAVGAGLCWAYKRSAALAFGVGVGVLFYSALGRALVNAAFGLAVAREAKKTMFGIASRWQSPGAVFFVALDDAGAPLGCVGIKFGHTLSPTVKEPCCDNSGTEASIWRLSVSPHARSQGVGRTLMIAAEAWARVGGIKHISLLCGNPESVKFYKKLEYTYETEARARTAMYGIGGRAAGFAGWFQCILDALLRKRVTSTVFCKKL